MTNLTNTSPVTVSPAPSHALTRDELKNAVRNATRESIFSAWRVSNDLPEHSGDMVKAQWVLAYDHFVVNADADAAALDVPADVPADAAADVLAPLAPFISDAALAPIRDALADAERRAADALIDADAAKQRAKDAVSNADMEIEAARASAAAGTVAPATTGTLRPVVQPRPVVTVRRTVTVADIMTGSASSIPVDVCDYADAPDLDQNYVLPVAVTETCFAAMSRGLNVAVHGEKGTGKSSLIRNIAALTKRPFFEIAFHAESSFDGLFGFIGPASDGSTEFVQGDLVKAMTTPYALIDLAEISVSRGDLVMALNSVLETSQRSIFVGGQLIRVAPGVTFFATTNDNGTGEQAHKYVGVKPMNEATKSRFIWVSLELPTKAQLTKVIAKRTGLAREGAELVAGFECTLRSHVKAGDCENTPGLRALLAWVDLTQSGLASRDALNAAALNSASSEDLPVWQNEQAANFDHDAFEAICRGEKPVQTRDGFTATE